MLPLTAQLAQAQAAEEKERGNKLFGGKKYKEAIESFTKCIELDPRYNARSNAGPTVVQADLGVGCCSNRRCCSARGARQRALMLVVLVQHHIQLRECLL